MLVSIFCSAVTPVFAVSAQPDVILVADCKINSATMHMTGTVNIHFNNTVLINQNLKLSYHIYDTYGDLMYYEGTRVPIEINGNNASVYIDVQIPYEEQKTDMRICFDIIDEQNLYWYSTDHSILFESDILDYGYNPWAFTLGLYRDIFTQQTVQLIFNLIFWGLTIWFIIYWKKRERKRKAAFAATTAKKQVGGEMK